MLADEEWLDEVEKGGAALARLRKKPGPLIKSFGVGLIHVAPLHGVYLLPIPLCHLLPPLLVVARTCFRSAIYE